MAAWDIVINGMDRITGTLSKYPAEIKAQMRLAGRDASFIIIQTKGLQNYPPLSAANQPGRTRTVTFKNGNTVTFRMSWYRRGYGTMVPVRGGDFRLIPTSKNYAKKFYTKPAGEMDTIVGNNAPYAQELSGQKQVAWAAEIGWRKLVDVANEKHAQIRQIYERHISYVTKKLGL